MCVQDTFLSDLDLDRIFSIVVIWRDKKIRDNP